MSKKPVPKKKTSVARSSQRTNKKRAEAVKRLLNIVQLDTCSQTGEKKLRHFASKKGFYRGVLLKGFAKKSEKKIKEISA